MIFLQHVTLMEFLPIMVFRMYLIIGGKVFVSVDVLVGSSTILSSFGLVYLNLIDWLWQLETTRWQELDANLSLF